MKHGKKDEKGFLERKALLKDIYPPVDRIIEYSLSKYMRKDVAKDDILGALAAALTAKLGCEYGLRTIPKDPELDSQGLPMKMVFFEQKRKIIFMK